MQLHDRWQVRHDHQSECSAGPTHGGSRREATWKLGAVGSLPTPSRAIRLAHPMHHAAACCMHHVACNMLRATDMQQKCNFLHARDDSMLTAMYCAVSRLSANATPKPSQVARRAHGSRMAWEGALGRQLLAGVACGGVVVHLSGGLCCGISARTGCVPSATVLALLTGRRDSHERWRHRCLRLHRRICTESRTPPYAHATALATCEGIE